ncbi:MAG: hypothetical protein WC836_11370 [Desulfobacula sp.]|jgi:uncharacterized membrane protein YidH (DUF202 family)
MREKKMEFNAIAINEVQLILAEKRTSLSVMRTGIAVLALPISVMSFLMVTSKYFDILNVLHFFIPLGVINIVLMIFGTYLVIRSIVKMRHHDRLIQKIKSEHSIIAEFID